jgi:Gpi18-like mannosyltransferase
MTRTVILFIGIKILFLATLLGASKIGGIKYFSTFYRWDAQWYQRIAESGYGHIIHTSDGRKLSDYAFFPLYPITERIFHQLTGDSYIISGILISLVASILAVIAIYKIVCRLLSDSIAQTTVILWAALPISFVTTLAYSEALFTALAAWSLLFCIRKNWLRASIFAALAGLTRPTGLAVAIAIISSALIQIREERKNSRAWIAICIAPLGWVAYMLFVSISVGAWNGYSIVTRDWGNTIDGGWAFLNWIWNFLYSGNLLIGVAIITVLFVLAVQIYILIKIKLPSSIMIFTISVAVLAFITSGYFGSKPRYLLPLFPLLIPSALNIDSLSRNMKAAFLILFTFISSILSALWLTGSGPL